MAEPLPSSNEKTVVVTNGEFNRLQRRTTISLALSVLILALIVIGAIIHHHRMHHGFAGRDGRDGGRCDGHCQFGGGHHFHHFGGSGWGRQGGFDKRGGDGFRGGNEGGPGSGNNDRDERGPGGAPAGMPGMGGMHGMMSGPMGKPDPAKMTDGILNHLSTTLSLTEDEKTKIKPIIEQQVAEIQKQMEAQRAAMQKQIEDGKAKIRPLLTADQQKQLDAMPLPGQKPSAPDEAKQPAPKPGQ
jgi:hypothetical protein